MRPEPEPVLFVLVGGFLGAGKTTALLRLADTLVASGERVAMIVNDKAGELVDTAVVKHRGLPVAEIAGGCFCCRLQDLIEHCDAILEAVDPTVLLAEPVGSTADLAASVLQPIRRHYGQQLRAATYSVLVDPDRLDTLVDGELAESPLGYLFRRQLEEADLIVLNKADRLDDHERAARIERLEAMLPATPVIAMSALTGEGLDDWWERVREGPLGGSRTLPVDDRTEIAGEMSLGWLNATIELSADKPFDAARLAESLLLSIRHGVARQVAEIGHVKLLIESNSGIVRASLVSVAAQPEVTETPDSPIESGLMTLNARVAMAADQLEALVARSLRKAGNEQGVAPRALRVESLQPGRAPSTVRFEDPTSRQP